MNPREYCFDLDRFLREVFEEHSLEVIDHITHADGYIEILFLYEGIEFECSVSRYSDNRVHVTLAIRTIMKSAKVWLTSLVRIIILKWSMIISLMPANT